MIRRTRISPNHSTWSTDNGLTVSYQSTTNTTTRRDNFGISGTSGYSGAAGVSGTSGVSGVSGDYRIQRSGWSGNRTGISNKYLATDMRGMVLGQKKMSNNYSLTQAIKTKR